MNPLCEKKIKALICIVIGAACVPLWLCLLALLAQHTDEVVFPLGILATAGGGLGLFAYLLLVREEV